MILHWIKFIAICIILLSISVFAGQYIGNLSLQKKQDMPQKTLPKDYVSMDDIVLKKHTDNKKDIYEIKEKDDIVRIKPLTSTIKVELLTPAVKPKTSEKKDLPDKIFKIQVGAFLNEEGAKRIQDELRQRGFLANIIKKQKQDQILFSVVVGKFETKQEAEKMRLQLKEFGYETFIID